MRGSIAFLLLFIMTVSFISGCNAPIYSPSMTVPDLEEMEVYQVLSSSITDDSTLDEMLDAFSKMCQIPMDLKCDMYLFEVHSYEYEGSKYLNCLITRQFETPGYIELIDVGFSVEYLLDDDIADFEETVWFEEDWQGFLDYIRNSDIYKTLQTKTIEKINVGIDSW